MLQSWLSGCFMWPTKCASALPYSDCFSQNVRKKFYTFLVEHEASLNELLFAKVIDIIINELHTLKWDSTVPNLDNNIILPCFDASWAALGSRNKNLQIFCEGLVSGYLATATVMAARFNKLQRKRAKIDAVESSGRDIAFKAVG